MAARTGLTSRGEAHQKGGKCQELEHEDLAGRQRAVEPTPAFK